MSQAMLDPLTEPVKTPSPDAAEVNGEPLRIPVSAATLKGFRAWAVSDDFPERGRISFLGEEIWIDMSPEIYESHGLLRGEIGRVILNLLRKSKSGAFFPDRTLVTNQAANLSTEPDGSFAFWKTLRSGRLRLMPTVKNPELHKEVEGTPDWVVEIISDSSVGKDKRRLRKLYHLAGIPEYWLIDARGDDIVFQILLHTPTGYVEARCRGQWQVSTVFGRAFRLDRQRGPLGIWQYTLRSKKV